MHNWKTVIIFMMSLALLGSSCTTPMTNEWVLLVDETDAFISRPTIEAISPKLGLEENQWCGAKVKKVIISNVEYGEEESIAIPAISSFDSNEFNRKKEKEQFILDLDSMMQPRVKEEYNQSIIFPIIIREVNLLAQSDSDGNKKLMIFSDLIENTKMLSFHNLPISRSDKNDGDLWAKLEGQYGCTLLDDLESLEITIVYKAEDFDHSQRFSKVAEIYKRKFEEKGAKVTITGTI